METTPQNGKQYADANNLDAITNYFEGLISNKRKAGLSPKQAVEVVTRQIDRDGTAQFNESAIEQWKKDRLPQLTARLGIY